VPNDEMKKMLHEIMRNPQAIVPNAPPMMLVTVRFKVGTRELKPLAIMEALAVGHAVTIDGKTYTVRQFYWREEDGVLHVDHVELADSLGSMEDSLDPNR